MIFIDRSKVDKPLLFSGGSETMATFMQEGEKLAVRQRTALDVLNVLNGLQFALEGFKRAKKDNNQSEKKRNKDFISQQLKALKGYFKIDAPYLGLKRDMLNELIKGDKNIKDLFDIFGIPAELSAMGVKKA